MDGRMDGRMNCTAVILVSVHRSWLFLSLHHLHSSSHLPSYTHDSPCKSLCSVSLLPMNLSRSLSLSIFFYSPSKCGPGSLSPHVARKNEPHNEQQCNSRPKWTILDMYSRWTVVQRERKNEEEWERKRNEHPIRNDQERQVVSQRAQRRGTSASRYLSAFIIDYMAPSATKLLLCTPAVLSI